LNSAYKYFIKDFCIYIHQKYLFIFFFLCISLCVCICVRFQVIIRIVLALQNEFGSISFLDFYRIFASESVIKIFQKYCLTKVKLKHRLCWHYTSNPCTTEAETGESQVPDQPGTHSQTFSQVPMFFKLLIIRYI
jgi:hypothetical protein